MFSFMKSLHFHLSQVGRQESADNKEPITDRKYANAANDVPWDERDVQLWKDEIWLRMLSTFISFSLSLSNQIRAWPPMRWAARKTMITDLLVTWPDTDSEFHVTVFTSPSSLKIFPQHAVALRRWCLNERIVETKASVFFNAHV